MTTFLLIGLYIAGWIISSLQIGRIFREGATGKRKKELDTSEALICSAMGLAWPIFIPIVLVGILVKKIANNQN